MLFCGLLTTAHIRFLLFANDFSRWVLVAGQSPSSHSPALRAGEWEEYMKVADINGRKSVANKNFRPVPILTIQRVIMGMALPPFSVLLRRFWGAYGVWTVP